ncbi:hypothetical protein E4U30_005785 [Claviceps sp. LM220 group G6]|nr:hypothetical protein E4U15_002878 [Claviceps sp. LM218 group G6]KAG6099889.1 hypothetical protein E4U30_005785 [Claviceps sp. LM220 group G6]KAG6102374.1 hypothetical protein E4U31_003363 [Claviceps sp. LM219 group G6]
MNFAPAARPIGCLKTVFRHARQQRVAQRGLATAVEASPASQDTLTIRQRIDRARVEKFQVYSHAQTIQAPHPEPMVALQKQQIERLDPTGARTRLFCKTLPDSAKVGDVLMVTGKNGDPFPGVFIQIRRKGVDTAIQLRGQLMNTGVEMWFKIYSPSVKGIDIVWRRPKRARRARVTYMRKPKHDMGSVDHLVRAWKKEKHSLSSVSRQMSGKKGPEYQGTQTEKEEKSGKIGKREKRRQAEQNRKDEKGDKE